MWEDGELVLSTPDAIGKAMERYVQRKAGQQPGAVAAEDVPPNFVGSSEPKTLTTCPECGSTVSYESSCLMCKHCGWSKC